jgi:hypothetical protein
MEEDGSVRFRTKNSVYTLTKLWAIKLA